MKAEYGVSYRQYPQSYQYIRRIANGVDPKKLRLFDVKWVQDFRGNDFLLFNSEWHINHTLDNNEGLELVEFGS
jgi:peptide subunit release factor RF-3